MKPPEKGCLPGPESIQPGSPQRDHQVRQTAGGRSPHASDNGPADPPLRKRTPTQRRHCPTLGLSAPDDVAIDRKSTRLNSSHVRISYAVFCLKKKKIESLL